VIVHVPGSKKASIEVRVFILNSWSRTLY
jgi:hypothetical protein